MVYRAVENNLFEVVVVAALRTKQLMRGCTPRVPRAQKLTTTARREVTAAKVTFAISDNGRAPAATVTGGSHVRPF